MNYLAALLILGTCFAFMAVGLLLKNRALKRGCSISPDDCACAREGKDPAECTQEPPQKNTP